MPTRMCCTRAAERMGAIDTSGVILAQSATVKHSLSNCFKGNAHSNGFGSVGRALQILLEARKMADGSGLIFPSVTGRPMSDNTVSKLLRKQGIPAVVHGFRSSFRDWCAECSNAPRESANWRSLTSIRTASKRPT